MTWRDRYSETASLEGIEFFVDSHRTPFGRRQDLHEHPQRDPYPEDIGPAARSFRLASKLLGPNYDVDRDRLIKLTSEEEGPHTLVHPWLGKLQVVSNIHNLRESTAEGGVAYFDLDFTLWTPPPSTIESVDNEAVVDAAADAVVEAAAASLLDRFSLGDAPGFIAEAATKVIDRAKDLIEEGLLQITNETLNVATALRALEEIGNAVDLARDPGAFVDELKNRVRDSVSFGDVDSALSFGRRLSNWRDEQDPVPVTTPTRQLEADNQDALAGLVEQVGLAELVRRSTEVDLGTRDAAVELRDSIFEEIDRQIDIAGDIPDDLAFDTLSELRRAIAARFDDLATRLPRVVTSPVGFAEITPSATLPALVIAHQVLGDVDRESEIVDLNGIRHPGFVPGGIPLRVLVGG